MYTVTIPVMIREGFQADETLSELKRAGADRVLLALPRSMKKTEAGSRFDTDAFMEVLKELIPRYEAAGLEVGVWLGETMGHGGGGVGRGDYVYQPFVSIRGLEANGGFCCADETFRADVCAWAAKAVEAGAKLVVLDDDWRMNAHGAGIEAGCMCPEHVRRYSRLVGEDLGREEIVSRVFSGGANRYRDAWRELMGGDMLTLAREIRSAVDRVDPDCRVGICTAPSVVGRDGADFMQIADALAGKNRPWVRLIGAPYWAKSGADLAAVMTLERMQAHLSWQWQIERGAEVLLEGDVYPRPRFVCPSAYLECADQIARADRRFTGAMKYMMDYTSSPRYEHGYIDRHVKNAALGREIEENFGRGQRGFVPLESPDLFRDMDFGSDLSPYEADRIAYEHFRGVSYRYLCGACVPVSFDAGVPVVFGENARQVGSRWKRVEYGAVLDAVAAQILTEKGWDVGAGAFGEAFGAKSPETFLETGEIVPFSGQAYRRIVPKEGAEVLTRFSDGSPAVFRYENKDGGRFLIYPIIASAEDAASTFFRSYERHRELMEQGRWIGEAYPEEVWFPADCAGNPDLYIITSGLLLLNGKVQGEIGLWNLFPDAVEEPVIELDAVPGEVRFLNCTGEVDGSTVRLSRIEPFGFAGIAFEGKRKEK